MRAQGQCLGYLNLHIAVKRAGQWIENKLFAVDMQNRKDFQWENREKPFPFFTFLSFFFYYLNSQRGTETELSATQTWSIYYVRTAADGMMLCLFTTALVRLLGAFRLKISIADSTIHAAQLLYTES